MALTTHEQATMKGQAVAQIAKQIYTYKNLKNEVVKTNPIDGGVEIFARVWENDIQIGFGADGSVDIERFVIINPPLWVPTGEKTVATIPHPLIEGEFVESVTDVFKENPTEAWLNVLEEIIKVKHQKFGDENIIHNRFGNTTTTIFSGSGDGGAVHSEANPGQTWTNLKAAAGNNNSAGNATGLDTYTIAATTTNQWRYLGQGHFPFDSSSIPDSDTISSATFSVYGSTTNGGKVDNNGHSVSVVESTMATSTVTNSDYEAFNTTKFATDLTITSWADSAYNDFSLNASGIANISKTGVDKFALCLAADVSGTDPSWTSGAAAGVDTTYSEQTGTSQDPKLVVEHGSAARLLTLLGVG